MEKGFPGTSIPGHSNGVKGDIRWLRRLLLWGLGLRLTALALRWKGLGPPTFNSCVGGYNHPGVDRI